MLGAKLADHHDLGQTISFLTHYTDVVSFARPTPP